MSEHYANNLSVICLNSSRNNKDESKADLRRWFLKNDILIDSDWLKVEFKGGSGYYINYRIVKILKLKG